MKRPYKAEERNGYWICVDKRSGQHVSYPTTQANARREAGFMNRAYQESVS